MGAVLEKTEHLVQTRRHGSTLFPEFINFNDPFFTSYLITYIGNKRSLLPFINRGVEKVKERLGRKKLVTLDGFVGSGATARLLKHHSSELWVNDLEDYCEVINKCYLSNRSEVDLDYINSTIHWLNENKLEGIKEHGFIERNYAPKNDDDIWEGERVFYTNKNARILDNLKRLIKENINKEQKHFFLAPLIVKASIHTNTSGVFKGFHKKDGLGHFGGRGENALTRILAEIELDPPLFSETECPVVVKKMDINKLVRSNKTPWFDLAYFDPPYNQHPYGSNYFMLNILANGTSGIPIQNGVSGIAKDWNRSEYNRRQRAEKAMDDLIENTPAKYILISYNNEGIIPIKNFEKIVQKYGTFDLMEQEYNTYRGSRNLNGRSTKVKELLWVLKKW